MKELFNDLGSIPPIPAMLLSIFAGAIIRAINTKSVRLSVALKGFATGIAFGVLGIGVVYLFWMPDLRAWWPLWFLLSYFGNVIHGVVEAAGDRLAKSPWKAVKQVLEYLLEQALAKLRTPDKNE